MSISSRLDAVHLKARGNKWLQYFAILMRVGLAAGFLPSGLVKILGERFTSLPSLHPMGAYLDALHRTGFYYTALGIGQVLAAILLLIPRTVTLGALMYFPIILNIWLLSLAVRFEGSVFSTTLMVMANFFLLCWDYHKLKHLLPFQHKAEKQSLEAGVVPSNKFPTLFFLGVFITAVATGLLFRYGYEIAPRITIKDCNSQCPDSKNPEACIQFCDCIHNRGETLDKCLEEFERAPTQGNE
jgi:uncharacterized membrane protein YphA (DoxX/SURF4 family)